MASGLIQLQEVQRACCRYLAAQLHPTNCLGIAHFAELHGCDELHQQSYGFAWQNFSLVVQSDEFQALAVGQVVTLISSDELGVSSEEDVFEAVCSWVKFARLVNNFTILFIMATLIHYNRCVIQNSRGYTKIDT